MTNRLAVDIGGTFVDALTFDRKTGEISLEKTPTTPDEPAEGVRNAIKKAEVDLATVETFIHGTTLGVNAFLEREGAATGIITNDGFEDVFEIGRYDRPAEEMFTIPYQKPETLVERHRRAGVSGRLDAEGNELEPIDEAELVDVAGDLIEEQGVVSLAVCFLHSYQNPDHERRAAAAIEEAYPDVSLSTSHEITGEYREYERTCTTVLDAYIKPIFESYVDELDGALADMGFDGGFFITRSGGGALSAQGATEAPVHTIMSGPAGGLIGSAHVGEVIDRDDLIAIDMGGTSLDACVIEDGRPAVGYESRLDGLPLMIPIYDIRTIGAGGGSIAWLDGDLLKAGPKSAGADPGPICYDRGGTEPTVTDAALALGYIDPNAFLGGEMELNAEAAHNGIASKLAEPLNSSVFEVSKGVFDVMIANTVGAIREITVEKGLDPRDFSMVAYGGAGPLVVPMIASELGVGEIVVPQAPAVFSAWGMLMANVVYDFSQTELIQLEKVSQSDIEEIFESLETDAAATLGDEGFDSERRRIERSVEMRYIGQEHTVEVPADELDSLAELESRFEAQHERRYGHSMEDPAEIVHLRVRGIGVMDKPDLEPADTADNDDSHVGTLDAYCIHQDERVEFAVHERRSLADGDTIDGPAIIREPTTTIVLHSNQAATVDEYGHIIIQTGDN